MEWITQKLQAISQTINDYQIQSIVYKGLFTLSEQSTEKIQHEIKNDLLKNLLKPLAKGLRVIFQTQQEMEQ